MRSITTVIQYIYKHIYKCRRILVSDTNGLLIPVQGDTRRETQFLKVYANHALLTTPQHAANLVVFKTFVGRDKKKSNCIFQRSKSNCRLNGPISIDVFSESSDSQKHLSKTWRHPHSSPISCLGVYYDKWWLSYPLCASVKLHQMTMHLD